MSTPAKPTFETLDCFGLKDFSEHLEKFIEVESDYIAGSLVFSLNAGFGSGKTSFIEMWSERLLQMRKNDTAPVPMPVIINAWESDHCGDPLLAVLAGLTEAIELWQGPEKPNKDRLLNAAKDVAWFSLGVANEFVAQATKINPIKAAEHAEKKRAARTVEKPDFIKRYRNGWNRLKN